MPRIVDVLAIREKLNVLAWDVETDRGQRTFEVRYVRQNVRGLGRQRLIIRDVDGNRYEIRNWRAFPQRAQRLIERYL
jgi:hypothetical protein